MMNKKYLNQIFDYKDGHLYWKVAKQSIKIGDQFGCLRNYGYIVGNFDCKYSRAHRLIFMWHYGFLPKEIDHIDGNPSNNRIENLRQANRSENGMNQKLNSRNTSGVKGVTWKKDKQKWHARVKVNKKNKHLGYFDDLELAELVVQEVRNKFHGEFARHQ